MFASSETNWALVGFHLCYILKMYFFTLFPTKIQNSKHSVRPPKMEIKVISLAIWIDINVSQIGKQIHQLTMKFVKQMWFYRNVMHCWRHAKYQRPRVFSWSLKIKCSIYPLNLVTCVIQLYMLLFISN